jgi:hypothetical protein
MIDKLGDRLETFAGAQNRTRCFAHIINLIAQTVIRQFDIPKTKGGGLVDEAMKELRVLAEDIDIEELLTRANNTHKDGDNDDNLEGLVNEWSGLSTGDLEELEADVRPVRRVLVKVSMPCQRVVHTLSTCC